MSSAACSSVLKLTMQHDVQPQRFSAIEHQYGNPHGYPRDEIIAALERPLSSLSINKPLPPPAPSSDHHFQPSHHPPPPPQAFHPQQGSTDWQQPSPPIQHANSYGPPPEQINPYLQQQQQSYPPQHTYSPVHSGYSTPAPQGEYYPPPPVQHQQQHQHQLYQSSSLQPQSYHPRPLPAPEQPQEYAQEMLHANSYPGALPQQQPYMPPRSPVLHQPVYEQQQPPIPPRTPVNDYYAPPQQYNYQQPVQHLQAPGPSQADNGRHSPAPPTSYAPQQYAPYPQGSYEVYQEQPSYPSRIPAYYPYQPDTHYLADSNPPPPRPLPVPDSYRPSPPLQPGYGPQQGWSAQHYRENGR